MAVLSVDQLYQYATNAGFTGSARDTIVAIAQAESSGATTAINTSDPNGGSYGVLQINGFWFNHGITKSGAIDPQTAFNFAYNTISKQGTNFSDWGTYTSGAYKQYLGQSTSNTTPASTPTDTSHVYSTDVCQTPIIGGLICSGFFEQAVLVLVGLIIAVIALVALAAPEAEKVVAGGKR